MILSYTYIGGFLQRSIGLDNNIPWALDRFIRQACNRNVDLPGQWKKQMENGRWPSAHSAEAANEAKYLLHIYGERRHKWRIPSPRHREEAASAVFSSFWDKIGTKFRNQK